MFICEHIFEDVMSKKFLVHTWKDLTEHMINLAEQIETRQEKTDLIIAIARGGLTIAHLLSDLLKLPVASFTVSSYHELKRSDELKMLFEIGGKLDGQHVLLVDDVSDSGRTFLRATRYLSKNGAAKITTASVFIKPKTEFSPDVYVEETDKWIIFPFDLLENLRDIRKQWRSEGIAEEIILQRFARMKIPRIYLKRLFLEP